MGRTDNAGGKQQKIVVIDMRNVLIRRSKKRSAFRYHDWVDKRTLWLSAFMGNHERAAKREERRVKTTE